ncbi:MAG: DNA topoisomerase I [Planctomycetaceae bacterium]
MPVLQQLDNELEKDIEQWFRGSLLLLVATKNFELFVAGLLEAKWDWNVSEENWLLTALRLMLAIAVIEAMPDQDLFSIIHSGPPKFHREPGQSWWQAIRANAWPILRGIGAQHLSRSSAVFAIIAVILKSTVGWVCYFLAIIQFLIIGLVTTRDRALDVLSQFDERVAERRQELIDEFHIDAGQTRAPLPTPNVANQPQRD